MFDSSSRRTFLSKVSALVGGSFAGDRLFQPHARASSAWDFSWIDGLRGKHKQVFSVNALVGRHPLNVVTNYLDGHLEVFGLSYPDVNTVVGITDPAFPINANDALWAKYELGRRWQIQDPDTGDWAKRNVYMENVPAAPGKVVGVKTLQARGTIFWQCNNALGTIVRRFASELKQPPDAIRDELIAGLNPGVKLVPAHTMALGLVQEHGCTYEAL
jgi:hypothetical protein